MKCIYCKKESTHSFGLSESDEDEGYEKYYMCEEHYGVAMKLIGLYFNKYGMEYVTENLVTILKIPQE